MHRSVQKQHNELASVLVKRITPVLVKHPQGSLIASQNHSLLALVHQSVHSWLLNGSVCMFLALEWLSVCSWLLNGSVYVPGS